MNDESGERDEFLFDVRERRIMFFEMRFVVVIYNIVGQNMLDSHIGTLEISENQREPFSFRTMSRKWVFNRYAPYTSIP